jgi:uncharacterized membrane protein YdjX (TVP38/TMEM64 family)
MARSEGTKSRSRWKLVIGGLVVVALIVLGSVFNVQRYLRDALAWITEQGMAGVLVYAALYMLATVLFVPGSILTLGAGFIYGLVQGSILVSVASTIGATLAFLVGRYLARDWVASKVRGNEKFAAIDDAVGREGWKIVGLTRLSPIFPFNMLNYAYGLTKVDLKGYALASWIGMMPGTVMYVYIGSLAGDLATLGAGERTRTVWEWILYGVGLAATVVVTVFVTRLARKTLTKKVDTAEAANESAG